jgi:hypothetical protein
MMLYSPILLRRRYIDWHSTTWHFVILDHNQTAALYWSAAARRTPKCHWFSRIPFLVKNLLRTHLAGKDGVGFRKCGGNRGPPWDNGVFSCETSARPERSHRGQTPPAPP